MNSDQGPSAKFNASDSDQSASQQPRWPWTTKEHRDFHFDRGACVFTREALFSRGHCCDSGCRNCPYRNPKTSHRRVHVLVPSWTETLLFAGAQVVGRTRYCIHPRDLVSSIPSHGGTKTLQTESSTSSLVRPGDLVILDRDENPKAYLESFQSLGAEVLATHVRNLEDLHRELGLLGEVFSKANELEPAQCFNHLRHRAESLMRLKPSGRLPILQSIGQEWSAEHDTALVIWQQKTSPEATDESSLGDAPQSESPRSLMLASPQVFLGDVFSRLTGRRLWCPPEAPSQNQLGEPFLNPYPQVPSLPQGMQVLLVTEPFPFWRNFENWAGHFMSHGARGVYLVDGEAMSWFGLRSLRLLEALLEG
ncbi:MAG TPA: helical backbone metal receptor [Pseudobdellovibrionaceae bacterium]|nr:helical backbone metal receptor [Pseudobdellovibrionaceae bacterium]